MANRSILNITALVAGLAFAHTASAQVDLISPETIHGVLDLRLSAANGEPSFTDGGFGKARYGGDGGSDLKTRLQLANATLEWTPRLNWAWSAVVDAIAQPPGQEHAIDFDQAYILFKPVPRSTTRFEARIGYFYPPVSLENDFRGWGVTNTITPSAIDTWIGEEVKVVGVEGSVSRTFGEQEVSATVGVFGYDDTSGTLLSFRGWALHDIQGQANGSFDLPPLSPFFARVQDSETYTTLEIDHQPGVYGRIEWRPMPSLALHAFYYDNRGDKIGVTPDLQWAWATRFGEAGLSWDLDDRTRILAQGLTGRTIMGYQTPGGRFVDMDFRAAYLLATRTVGKSALTGRFDIFDTHDNSALFLGDTNEHGWAVTGAWRYPLTRLLDIRLEALHVDSTRPARVIAGEAPDQSQTVLQSSLRLSF